MTRTERLPGSGLRERKKVRTRAAIQAEALRLFHEQGYDATTMEQIARAADVSPSTVFHCFATKADLGGKWQMPMLRPRSSANFCNS